MFTRKTEQTRQIITDIGKEMDSLQPHALWMGVKWFSHWHKHLSVSENADSVITGPCIFPYGGN